MKWWPLFHNGQCQYSISVNIRKSGDPNFGEGLVIKNFAVLQFSMKWQPIFHTQTRLKKVFTDFHHIFAFDDLELGKTNIKQNRDIVKHVIRLEN